MSATTQDRRAVIRSLITMRQVATQEDLRTLLAERGYDVTQATLSRDLAQLGARRAAQPGGGTHYELADAPRPALLGDMVRDIADNGTLVVVHTTPGAASVVAGILDSARVPEVLGTIAGDDAIFIAPARGISTTKLVRKLRELVTR